jgi:ornithine cyclodeaminase
MIYLNDSHIRLLGINWLDIKDEIHSAIRLLDDNDFSQPIKPYLRYRDPQNRIIAMPAFIGGKFNIAGIKWIASFPGNIAKGKARAHSVTILNESESGSPIAIINGALISAIRTSGVSCYLLDSLLRKANDSLHKLKIGIIGFGPIGQLHLEMLLQTFSHRIDKIYLYDLKKIDPSIVKQYNAGGNVLTAESWEEVHDNTDVLITCTVSRERYVIGPPKKGNLYLNISLRDFADNFMEAVDQIIVDNWEEVCRENTDVELAFKNGSIRKEDVWEINNPCIQDISFPLNQSIMFNPMGMAIFDMAIAAYYFLIANQKGIKIDLPA